MGIPVHFKDLGFMDYQAAWDYQQEIFDGIVNLKIQNRKNEGTAKPILPRNHLLFVEHPHVYTLGKSGSLDNLLLDEDGLKAKEATFYKINRGGDITYHGPGQIVGYPILDLEQFFTDIHKYMRFLEESIILTLADYGLTGDRYEGYTGVWLDPDKPTARKICAMGVKSSRWVTMHGFAFNVNADLGMFNNIVPCGIDDKDVTSMQRELGHSVDIEEVKAKLKKHLAAVFEMELLG